MSLFKMMFMSVFVTLTATPGVQAAATTPEATQISAPTFADVDPQSNAEQTYLANAYIIIHHGSTPASNGNGSWWTASRGLVYRFPVTTDGFLASVGRFDLSAQATSNQRTSDLLNVGGALLGVAGLAGTLIGLFSNRPTLLYAGVGAELAAVPLFVVSSSVEKRGIPTDQAMDLAEQYNLALRRHLGLLPVPSPEKKQRPSAAAPPEVAMAPSFGLHGAGLMIGGRF
jgi:hypothetical protein